MQKLDPKFFHIITLHFKIVSRLLVEKWVTDRKKYVQIVNLVQKKDMYPDN